MQLLCASTEVRGIKAGGDYRALSLSLVRPRLYNTRRACLSPDQDVAFLQSCPAIVVRTPLIIGVKMYTWPSYLYRLPLYIITDLNEENSIVPTLPLLQ